MAADENPTLRALARMETIFRNRHRLLILTHDNPDPDSIASAVALKHLVKERFGIRATVAYGGMVGRAENRAMLRLLKIKLSPVWRIRMHTYGHIALVDTQPRAGNNSLPGKAKATIVIDHHPLRRTTKASLIDVRPEYGAVATILFEYLRACDCKISTALATALFYGIHSETEALGREATDADTQAYLALFSMTNKKHLARIERPSLPRSYFNVLGRSLVRASTYRNVVMARLGPVDVPELVAEVADLLVRLERITWSLCLAWHDDRLVLSIRTTNTRARAGRLIQRLVGRRGRAGGHNMLAGGWMDGTGLDEQEREQLEGEIMERFLRLTGHREAASLRPLIDIEPEDVRREDADKPHADRAHVDEGSC
jgi:nanoRNase/pAp phosphatase (c-di-AMP/oligoRNAs hydrolase)